MAYTKKIWVDVPDPSNPPNIPEGQDALARFDAENMNRIEDGIEKVATSGVTGMGASSTNGGAVGHGASSTNGGAVGKEALTTTGGAVGSGASSALGGAVGYNTKTGNGFAGGKEAKTVDLEDNPIDAIQLGSGTNRTPKTMQVYNYQFMKEDGTIPPERIPSKAPSGHGLGDIGAGTNVLTYNDVIQNGCGFYQVGDEENSPHGTSEWTGLIQVIRSKNKGSETGTQLAFYDFDKSNPRMWLRTLISGKSSKWVEMLHTGNTPQTQIVSYVGTGTYGVDNCCQLTFNFAPRIIKFLACVEGDKQRGLDYYDRGSSTGVRGNGFLDVIVCDLLKTDGYVRIGLDDSASSDSDSYGCKTKDGKTVYWYNTSSSMGQCNYKDYTYYFMAIG